MKAHPILFSGAMVRALLDGSKTQTRRAVKFPSFTKEHWRDPGLGAGEYFKVSRYGEDTVHRVRCPYGMAGDLLWVRETWACYRLISYEYDEWEQVATAAERAEYHGALSPVYAADKKNYPDQWHPSIHMPRWASRLTLEITGVRVERLQDISEADAKAEGCHYIDRPALSVGYYPAYRELWESINGAGTWANNPWVWVIKFKVHHKNVDALLSERGARA